MQMPPWLKSFFDQLKEIDEQIQSIPVVREIISLIFITFIVFGFTWVILRVAHKSIEISQRKFGEAGKKRAETLFKLVKSISRYITIPTYIILILPVFGIDPSVVFASAGVVGLIVGFAFQDFLKDIVSGLFIIFERVYEVEDYITIDKQYTGTVTSITLKCTTLVDWTGEIYTINNRDVKNVTNYSTADFAVSVNSIKVARNVPFEKINEAWLEEKGNSIMQFKDILIDEPFLKGIDSIDENGYVVEFHSKVHALSQYQYRRDFNFFLMNMCLKHNIELSVKKVEIINE